MIQRIQSLFLLLIITLGIVMFFVPVAEFVGNGATLKMSANHFQEYIGEEVVSKRFIGVGVLSALVIVLSIIITLLFKKRQLQIRLGKLNILLLALELTAIFLYTSSVQDHDSEKYSGVVVDYGVGAFIPIVSMVLMYLAVRFIKKDDELIRSADRLR